MFNCNIKINKVNPENSLLDDHFFMNEALKLAARAAEEDEIPIGAVLVLNNRIIGKGHNQTERLHDVTAHAEMIAITAGSHHLQAKFLEECALYVTIEPCPMCAAAIQWARIGKVVYGASEPKFGYSRFSPALILDKTEIIRGIESEKARQLMQDFFRSKRK